MPCPTPFDASRDFKNFLSQFGSRIGVGFQVLPSARETLDSFVASFLNAKKAAEQRASTAAKQAQAQELADQAQAAADTAQAEVTPAVSAPDTSPDSAPISADTSIPEYMPPTGSSGAPDIGDVNLDFLNTGNASETQTQNEAPKKSALSWVPLAILMALIGSGG